MSLEEKEASIKNAVDEFLRRIFRYMQDDRGNGTMPEEVKTALDLAYLACSGDIPETCREMAIKAIPRVYEEMRKFNVLEPESFVQRGNVAVPSPRFWSAVRELNGARIGAEPPIVEVLEPVCELVDSGVSYDQIAFNIYGRRGKGPFVTPQGTVNVMLIKRQVSYERQMIEKGKSEVEPVIPPDWTPPWCVAAADERRKILEERGEALRRLENPRRYVDPATIEQLLMEGATIQQIERVKGVSREEIVEAAVMAGLEAKDAPGFGPPARALQENEESGSAAIKSRVIEMHLADPSKENPAIAEELRKEGFVDAKPAQVAAIIVWYKRRQKELAAAQ